MTVRDLLIQVLDEAIYQETAGLCVVCDQPSLRLVWHHWREPSKKQYDSAMVCERCNGLLYPRQLWIGAEWPPHLPGLDHILPSLDFQRRWLREIWPFFESGGSDKADEKSVQRVFAAWEHDLSADYAIVREMVSADLDTWANLEKLSDNGKKRRLGKKVAQKIVSSLGGKQ